MARNEKPVTLEKIHQELESSYQKWEHGYEFGMSDPFWEDGINLNLIRNHISFYQKVRCKLYPDAPDHPLYHRPLPPKLDHRYMAKADEIREHGKRLLEQLRSEPAYQALCEGAKYTNPDTLDKLKVTAALDKVESIGRAIRDDDLPLLRRSRYEDIHAACEKSLKALRDYEPPDHEQLSFSHVTL